MFVLAVVIFGVISFTNLRVDLLPDITYPTLTVRTDYPGSAPSEVESLVSSKIESAVGIVSGVVNVQSSSRASVSDVVVEFDWGTDMDFASIDIRENLETVQLPSGAEKPRILRFDPSLDPIMRISLFGADDLIGLRLLAGETVRRRIESIEGVASVLVVGGAEEEIHVEIDEARLATRGISVAQVVSRLRQENINLTGGVLVEGGAEFLVRILNQFITTDEISDIVVGESKDGTVAGASIRLRDVAELKRGIKQRTVIHRTNGEQSVELAVYKEAAANTVSVSDIVQERLAGVEGELDQVGGTRLSVVFDQATFIRLSIRGVINTALWGGLLAVIVLFLFIREVRSTAIIGIAIPVSIVATFFFMFLANVSLNIMSLGGLALGIGMLVDNSIVVLESINRHTGMGKSKLEAAKAGGGEVGKAVSAATLTTICVFIPVIFLQGIAGQLFTDPALTVTFSLIASLALSLTLLPMLYSVGGSRADEGADKESKFIRIIASPIRGVGIIATFFGKVINVLLRPIYLGFDKVFITIESLYPKNLSWALSHKTIVIAAALVVFGASVILMPFLGSELIPEVSRGEFSVEVETPVGTPVEETDTNLLHLKRLSEDVEDITLTYSIAGTSSAFGSSENNENIGELNISLADGVRDSEEEKIIEELRRRFENVPGIALSFARPPLFTFDSPIEIAIKGYDLNTLSTLSTRLSEKMSGIAGLADIKSSLDAGNPEIQITFDRQRLAELGINVQSVAEIIRRKIQGDIATEYETGNRKIDIRVRAREQDREDIADLRRLIIGTREEVPISLASLAFITVREGPADIRRTDQERAAIITANLAGRDLGSVISDIEREVESLELPRDFNVEIGGQRQEMSASFDSLRFAILLAILLVYLVMAAQFESLLQPFIILFAVPFGMSGVILMLLISGTSISVIVLIGIIIMAGIVVNNAIVLVDYINRLIRSGMETATAVQEAAKVRLRPILMTTSTTVLALVPMAVSRGEGWEIRAPLALTVIGGLIVSTMVTLILVPSIYTAIYSLIKRRAT